MTRSRTATVEQVLGGRKTLGRQIRSDAELIGLVRSGLKPDAFSAVTDRLGVSEARLASALNLPLRTLHRRKSTSGEPQRLKPTESDRLVRAARVFAAAVDALGDEEKARGWLQRSNRALGGEVPLDLLDTEIGARRVEQVLGRIAYGVYS